MKLKKATLVPKASPPRGCAANDRGGNFQLSTFNAQRSTLKLWTRRLGACAAVLGAACVAAAAEFGDNVRLRGDFQNARIAFEREGKGTVASIDGGPFQQAELYHAFSKDLHYPRTVMFTADAAEGAHTLTLRVSGETRAGGHAARIIHFVAN